MTTEPVSLAQDLAPLRVMRAQIGDKDLAIWRSASGKVSAWGNRCPHRGMRLSHGFVREDSLACAYHGWHYDCSGHCHYIPAHPELAPPPSIKPEIYSVTEQDGLLWVSTTEDAVPVALPDNFTGVRSISLACSVSTAVHAYTSVTLQDDALIALNATEFSNQPAILSLSAPENTVAVIVLFQQPSSDSVVSHVLAKKSWSPNGRIRISRWCESVRRHAERESI